MNTHKSKNEKWIPIITIITAIVIILFAIIDASLDFTSHITVRNKIHMNKDYYTNLVFDEHKRELVLSGDGIELYKFRFHEEDWESLAISLLEKDKEWGRWTLTAKEITGDEKKGYTKYKIHTGTRAKRN